MSNPQPTTPPTERERRLVGMTPSSLFRLQRMITRVAAEEPFPRNTGRSSAFFGLCKVCGEYASEVWSTQTHEGAGYAMGHEACVRPLTSTRGLSLTAMDRKHLQLDATAQLTKVLTLATQTRPSSAADLAASYLRGAA